MLEWLLGYAYLVVSTELFAAAAHAGRAAAMPAAAQADGAAATPAAAQAADPLLGLG